jgi:hypothetical protein
MGVLLLAGVSFGSAAWAADFNGDGRGEPTIFRRSQCKWVAYGVTNFYFGNSADQVVCDDYNGDGRSDAAVYRPSESMWTVRNVTRVWFGSTGDVVVPGGGGGGLYDYVVKPGDGDDLQQALESDIYDSVFIPAGEYGVPNDIVIDHVTQVTGESMQKTIITFARQYSSELYITSEGCHLEKLTIKNGGGISPLVGSINIQSGYVSLRECRVLDSEGAGFNYTVAANYVSFVDCIADHSDDSGFACSSLQPEVSARFTNCAARLCASSGFLYCNNLTSCYVWGNGETQNGFIYCDNLAACHVEGCTNEYPNCLKKDSDSCD